jgi:hypothetical protein
MSSASIAAGSTNPAQEAERNAYNAAFYELGLRWHWDAATFAALQAHSSPGERILHYIQTQHPHLLRAYDAQFLVQVIEAKKTCFEQGAKDCGAGSAQYFDWAETGAAEVGV